MDMIKQMYEELKRCLAVNGKLVEDSAVLSFLNIKSNTRLSLLDESAFDIHNFNGLHQDYVDNHLIQKVGTGRKYCLTAQAIWEQEKGKLIDNNLLIGYLQEKIFNCPAEDVSLSEKERVILLAFIMGRAFSPHAVMDLKLGDEFLNNWAIIIMRAYDLLAEVRCIAKLKKEDVFGKQGNEHPVSNLIRHTDSLPKKTALLFSAPGEQKYLLNLAKENSNSIHIENLAFMFSLIFERQVKLRLTETDKISEVCNQTANSIGVLCYKEANEFISYENDNIIRDVLEEF